MDLLVVVGEVEHLGTVENQVDPLVGVEWIHVVVLEQRGLGQTHLVADGVGLEIPNVEEWDRVTVQQFGDAAIDDKFSPSQYIIHIENNVQQYGKK